MNRYEHTEKLRKYRRAIRRDEEYKNTELSLYKMDRNQTPYAIEVGVVVSVDDSLHHAFVNINKDISASEFKDMLFLGNSEITHLIQEKLREKGLSGEDVSAEKIQKEYGTTIGYALFDIKKDEPVLIGEKQEALAEEMQKLGVGYMGMSPQRDEDGNFHFMEKYSKVVGAVDTEHTKRNLEAGIENPLEVETKEPKDKKKKSRGGMKR